MVAIAAALSVDFLEFQLPISFTCSPFETRQYSHCLFLGSGERGMTGLGAIVDHHAYWRCYFFQSLEAELNSHHLGHLPIG